LGVITIILLRFALAAKRRKSVTGEAGMIGLKGVAHTDIDPEGSVIVHGELWKARAAGRIPQGARVRVREIEGLTLVVESAQETR
jgi:membrane-bound serine protease (ClpP class)